MAPYIWASLEAHCGRHAICRSISSGPWLTKGPHPEARRAPFPNSGVLSFILYCLVAQ